MNPTIDLIVPKLQKAEEIPASGICKFIDCLASIAAVKGPQIRDEQITQLFELIIPERVKTGFFIYKLGSTDSLKINLTSFKTR